MLWGDNMKKLVCLFLGIIMCMSVTACGTLATDKVYPVKFDDTEILVGKTTVSELLDNGFILHETYGGELDKEQPIEKNSYYSGIIVVKDDVEYAMISVVSEKKDIPLSEAIIANILIKPSLEHAIERIYLDGVALPDLTADVFKEHIAGSRIYDDGTGVYCSGDQYTFRAYYEDGNLTEVNALRNYSVQYGT